MYGLIVTSLNNLGIKYRIYKDPRKTMVHFIVFGDSVYVKLFEDLCGRYSENKHLPSWFRNLSVRQMNFFLKILYLGDGSHNTTRQ